MNFLKWGVILEEFTFFEEFGLIPLEKVFYEFAVELIVMEYEKKEEGNIIE